MSNTLAFPDEFVLEQIHFLSCLTGMDYSDFRHQEIGVAFPEDAGLTPHALVRYKVPKGYCLIVTGISLATIPPPNDPSLTAGDWRSMYYDAIGNAKLWLSTNGNPKTPVNTSFYILTNQDVLFLFNQRETMRLMAQRTAADPPPTETVLVAMCCFIAPAKAYDKLAANETQIIASFA